MEGKNRLTFHGGYRSVNGKPFNSKHNRRENFKKPKSDENNRYWNYVGIGTSEVASFSESEKAFYKYAFGDFVKHKNEKNKKRGDYDRMTSNAEYREKHPPEEVLLYLGTNDVNPRVLVDVFEEFRQFVNDELNDSEKGCGIEILNAALHLDEKTPHIHFRQVYYYTDKNGDFQVSQNKALEGLGFKRPDPTHKSTPHNNVKMTFTAFCREKLFEIARSYGVNLETEPLPEGETGLSIREYKEREQSREAWKREQRELCAEAESVKQGIQAEREELRVETEKAERELAEHEQAIENAYDELEKAVEKSNAEIKRNEDIMRDQRQEIDSMREYNAFRRANADERAKQDAQKARDERKNLAREICEKVECAVSGEKIVSRGNPQKAAEEENAREAVQNAAETSEAALRYPDTPKPQNPLERARGASAYADLKKANAELNAELITAEEAAALLLAP